jgi:hypothetical protein
MTDAVAFSRATRPVYATRTRRAETRAALVQDQRLTKSEP